jgi:phospholipid transport system substrate-binding protein
MDPKNRIARLSLIFCLHASTAFAGPPADVVKSTVDQAIKILTDPRYQGEAKKDERRKLLRDTISPRFDFQEMAKRALAAEWDRRTPEEQKEFVRVFTAFLEKASVQNVEAYNNERFTYGAEKIDGFYAVVEGRIINAQKEETKITYLLHRAGGEWKVYDLVASGISFVSNYRSQFGRIVRQSGYDGLLRVMREKLAGNRAPGSGFFRDEAINKRA